MSKRKDPRVEGPHEVTAAGENIFAALGFSGEESADLLMRSQLMHALKRWRKGAKLSQAEAGKRLGVSQGRISDLERGQIEIFSLDTLVRFAVKAGLKPVLQLAA
jgi:predicted XRE-type DNA-binding protein